MERIREEIKAERASAAAARTIERQRRETLLNRDLGNLRKSQETVNQRVDNIVMAVTKLTKVEVKAAGRTIGEEFVLKCCMLSASFWIWLHFQIFETLIS